MANQWFKFYGTEYLSDPKMLSLTACQRSCWVTLMSYASVVDEDGVVKHLTEDQLMIQAGIDYTRDEWNCTKGVLSHFEKLCMVTIDSGVITLCNWQKRQEIHSDSYERLKKWRSKKKDETDDNVSETFYDNGKNRIEENRIEENRREHTHKLAFDEFWNLYPKKVNRKRSEQKWKTLDFEAQQKILEVLPKQNASAVWMKEGGQFIPHPTTYLNGERWNDQVEVPKANYIKI